ncbi:hypothetical protein CGLO_04338 [Colletotrichum gloeosporioides Cg-14]|uniref:Uncharacterized protein n=1 Tax=Colletotrichum gloeosporioides (strain Cg-14) TaxID=1237896 RepID=T0KSS0_COLGC|nr:hypothetical protein CGLO_04338 [Colletotrichum gloeosporioides Cg-14]
MGLSLHNSADALNLLSQGPSQVTHPRTRAHYKGAFLRADGSLSLNREYADQRFHLLDLVLHANHQRRAQRHRTRRRRQTNRSIQQWRSDQTDEGRELAALDGVSVPGETPQRRRTPSLERQGAFRLPGTTRSRIQQDEEGLDELYRLGLLYDDEHLRGEGFELGSIAHPEPEYTVRPAKRARGSQAQRRSYEDDLQLALDLSLAELGRDESFARYLCSPDLDEPPSEDDGSSHFTSSQFDSGLLSPPDSDTEDTPDLTTDSESDRLFLSSSTSFSSHQHWAMTRPRSRRGRAANNHGVSDNAWMVLGDGS